MISDIDGMSQIYGRSQQMFAANKCWILWQNRSLVDFRRLTWPRVPASVAPAGRKARTTASVPTPEAQALQTRNPTEIPWGLLVAGC
jgi:hypothetical protein